MNCLAFKKHFSALREHRPVLQRRLSACSTVNDKSIVRSLREAILQFYMALVIACLDTLSRFVPFSFIQKKIDIDMLLSAEQKVNKMVRGWSMSLHKERLRGSDLFSLEKRQLKEFLLQFLSSK